MLSRSLAVVAAMIAALVPASAGASVTVGQTQAGSLGCAAGDEVSGTLVSSGPDYVVPSAGVLTEWRTFGGALDAGDLAALRVYTSQSASLFTPVFDSGFQNLTSGPVNAFPTRATVAAGQYIGLRVGANSGSSQCTSTTLGAGNEQLFHSNPPSAVGVQETFTLSGDFRPDIEAQVEPDADADGYGDETQDLCPANPQSQSPPCLSPDATAPETTLTKAPKAKTTKRQATFDFVSSEAGASFECSVDGAAFAGCIAPRIVKARKGKHVFQVRAIDAAGNKDASPARASWKVIKKRKRRH